MPQGGPRGGLDQVSEVEKTDQGELTLGRRQAAGRHWDSMSLMADMAARPAKVSASDKKGGVGLSDVPFVFRLWARLPWDSMPLRARGLERCQRVCQSGGREGVSDVPFSFLGRADGRARRQRRVEAFWSDPKGEGEREWPAAREVFGGWKLEVEWAPYCFGAVRTLTNRLHHGTGSEH